MVLLARSALNVPALTWKFLEKVNPLAVGRAATAQSCASSFTVRLVEPDPVPRSFLASYHAKATFPLVGSTAILGRNWLNLVRSVFTLRAELQVPLSSSEKRTRTSVFAEETVDATVYT